MDIRRLLIGLMILVLLVGCDDYKETADRKATIETERSMKEAYAQTGLPAIKNYQERKLMKMIYELRDQEDLVCYAYYFNQIEGKRGDFIGKCIGYGLPASIQYSNPEKVITFGITGEYRYAGSSPSTIQQPEPNGLFMPQGLSATWLMLIDPKTNKPRPVYIEPLIIVSPFKLH